jgi:hypothetical protein
MRHRPFAFRFLPERLRQYCGEEDAEAFTTRIHNGFTSGKFIKTELWSIRRFRLGRRAPEGNAAAIMDAYPETIRLDRGNATA